MSEVRQQRPKQTLLRAAGGILSLCECVFGPKPSPIVRAVLVFMDGEIAAIFRSVWISAARR